MVNWGPWEYSGGNGMRVGIDVDWTEGDGSGQVVHGSAKAKATVHIWTENKNSYSDGQRLNYGGAIGGSTSFTNGAGGAPVKRATKTYFYTYGNNEYGSSPGKRTFSASLSGAYNGVTPSKSVTSSIPARPIASPNDPGNVSVSRVSDSAQKVTWNNRSTSGRPWWKVNVDRDWNDNGNWSNAGQPGGGSSSFTDSATSSNQEVQYRVRAENGAGNSSWVNTWRIYTTPDPPTNASRENGTGAEQVITWVNKGGYTEYETEVQRGVTPAGSTSTTWTSIGTVASGVTTLTDTDAQVAEATRYRVRHRTTAGAQNTLYSAYSNETDSTPGVTTPPLAPVGLSPDDLTVDPTLKQRLTWQFTPAQEGDAQTKFDVQHRLSGEAGWTTVTKTTANEFYDLPANTYQEDKIVEWHVRTYGADPTPSPYSPPVSFQTAVVPIAAEAVKLPVQMDLFTGRLEADTRANEIRDQVLRIQSNVIGGGTRTVDDDYGISWSDRFIAISIGRSDKTFPFGHHDIDSPFGWNVSNRQIVDAGGTPRATLTVDTSDVRIRPGESITVRNVGAPYDGTFTCRSISSNQVSYDLPAGTATEASTPATGGVYATITGHGGAVDTIPGSSRVILGQWEALYYEMPFGWGGGSRARKNGLVNATSKEITSNVATIGAAAGHWFAVDDRVSIEGVDATFDGIHTVTGVTPTSISYDLVTADVATTPLTSGLALARPTGRDTFFGNFHLVHWAEDFVVPSNWVMIALRNVDSGTVEWGTGDTVDPGFDSDSPVFKQAIFTATQDVNANSGNTPALRVGDISATHLRIDGNELQAMDSDASPGGIIINQSGGGIQLGMTNGVSVNCRTDLDVKGFLDNPGHVTGNFALNANINADNGRIRRDTSARRYKENIQDAEIDTDRVLELRPRVFQRNDHRDPETDELVGYREDNPWYRGFIADEADELGLTSWVTYAKDNEGQPVVDGFDYAKWAVALQAVCQEQQRRIEALEARLGLS